MNLKIDKSIFYMLLASFCFALVGMFARLLAPYMSTLEVVFWRNIFGVVVIGLMFFKNDIPKPKKSKPWLLFFRAFIGLVAMFAFFYNLTHIPLADAMIFSRTSPIFAAILAWLILKEKMNIKEWTAVFVGFVGIVLVIRPDLKGLAYTDWLGLLSGIGAALAYTTIRELRKYYDTSVIVFVFTLTATIGPLLLMLISYIFDLSIIGFRLEDIKLPTLKVWLYIFGIGFFAIIAQVYMTRAYGIQKVGIIGAVSYFDVIVSIFLGVLLGDAFPDLLGWFGIILVILGGILVAKEKR